MAKYQQDPETMDPDSFDAQAISEWLQFRDFDPALPFSARLTEFKWAHENPSAWPNVVLPEGITANQAKVIMMTHAMVEPRANPNHDNKGRFATKGAGGGAAAINARTDGEKISSREADDLAEKAVADGGFTYDTNSAHFVDKGFAVSPFPERSLEIPVSELRGEDVHKYAEANKDLLSKPDHNLGGWHDTENGTVWLDVSIVKSSQDAATKVAIDHNQKAIFNLETFEEIPTGGTGAARALSPSAVERSTDPQPSACPECQANSDPANVPVHPGCHCNVVTNSVGRGVDPFEIDALIQRHEETGVEAVGIEELPEALSFLPDCTSVFVPESFRFGDLVQWVRENVEEFASDQAEEQVQEAVNVILWDQSSFESEDIEENAQTAEHIVLVRALKHVVGSDISTGLLLMKTVGGERSSKRSKRMILFPANATPEQMATAYQMIVEGQ